MDGVLWTGAQRVEELRRVETKYKMYVYKAGKWSWNSLWEKAERHQCQARAFDVGVLRAVLRSPEAF